MKKSFTLIELIFSMVIIAIAFMVLPKILQLSTKVSTQSIREEALYNGIALLGFIKATAWDEKNTKKDDILLVLDGDSSYECGGDNFIRIGGFIGSRNCKNTLTASPLGLDADDLLNADDMDDFISINASNYNNSRDFSLNVKINYIEDMGLSDESFKFFKKNRNL